MPETGQGENASYYYYQTTAGWVMNRVEPSGLANRFLLGDAYLQKSQINSFQMSLDSHFRVNDRLVSYQNGLDVAVVQKAALCQRKIDDSIVPDGSVVVRIAYPVDNVDRCNRSGYFSIYCVLPIRAAGQFTARLERDPNFVVKLAEEFGDVHEVGVQGRKAVPRQVSTAKVQRY
jgi:hypothetical protein